MRVQALRRHAWWLLPLLAAALVALLGTRLVVLGTHERADKILSLLRSIAEDGFHLHAVFHIHHAAGLSDGRFARVQFHFDESVAHQDRIEKVLLDLEAERQARATGTGAPSSPPDTDEEDS